MNNRERVAAILNYKDYDSMPVVHFGFWHETLEKWCVEGYLKPEEIQNCHDGSDKEKDLGKKLGFDFNWQTMCYGNTGLMPCFERKVLEESSDGMCRTVNEEGVIILEKRGVSSIPSEVDHLLKDRKSWEEFYLPKLAFSPERVNIAALVSLFGDHNREFPLGVHCGSLIGQVRNWLGVEGMSYLYADDEVLFKEIIDTAGELCYKVTESLLVSGVKFDFAHFWEDICFKNGPLVNPRSFDEIVGPYYKKITQLVNSYGIEIVSLDCDGMIDALIPTWLNNGVNTMFPIEVGTWDASIKPWREKYGKMIRGVGGMNKNVFAEDYAAIDKEIERLKPLMDLRGYIPCPDHRIPPTAKWENVRYYCDRMHKVFSD